MYLALRFGRVRTYIECLLEDPLMHGLNHMRIYRCLTLSSEAGYNLVHTGQLNADTNLAQGLCECPSPPYMRRARAGQLVAGS